LKKLTLIITVLAVVLAGCYQLPKRPAPKSSKIMDRYDAIILPQTETEQAAAEPTYSEQVMEMICNEELGEYLSQSEDIVCSWGQRSEGASAWLNMVQFDRQDSTVSSKYMIVIDQDAPNWGVVLLMPGEKFRLQLETVSDFGPQSSYPSVSAYNTAVLKEIYFDTVNNLDKIVEKGQALNNIKLTMNHTFSQIFEQVLRSPVKTELMTTENGMDFDHSSIGRGNVKLNFTDTGLVELTVSAKITATEYMTSTN
jgi:hypothetical protein